jgi:hypothetical protein
VTFIDWSDAEGMFGLFVDFVADERAECDRDPDRLRFLDDLLEQLRNVEAKLSLVPDTATIQSLKGLLEFADPGFADDPVVVHLNDLIDELEEVGNT